MTFRLRDGMSLTTQLPAMRPSGALLGAAGKRSSAFALRLANLGRGTLPPTLLPSHSDTAPAMPDVDVQALAAALLGGQATWRDVLPTRPEATNLVTTVPLLEVSNTVATALYQGATRVHVQVTPPQLGAVDVTVHLQGGVMQVVLQTETEETLTVLQDDLPRLRNTLRDAGLNVGALRLTLRRAHTDDPLEEEDTTP